jgi:hypothetical protein
MQMRCKLISCTYLSLYLAPVVGLAALMILLDLPAFAAF